MPPNIIDNEIETLKDSSHDEVLEHPKIKPRSYEIIPFNILLFSFLNISAVYGAYLCFTSAKWNTIFLAVLWFAFGQVGITAGAHRLWCHRTYKVKLPLEILLIIFNSIGFQNSAFDWVRNHRTHHKFSDEDADPHNARRGFFFSHIGWLLVRKHPEVIKRGKDIYMDDIYANRLVMFQKKYAIPVIGMFCFILPTVIPMFFWSETFTNAWNIVLLRYMTNLHVTLSINSIAHRFGTKPYDKSILPANNLICTLMTLGEGYHNYHHVFPWDYKSAEWGNDKYNFTTKFIELFAWLGLAYDLKSPSDDMVYERALRTGDGSMMMVNDENEKTK